MMKVSAVLSALTVSLFGFGGVAVAQSQPQHLPLCYAKNAEGQIVDLSVLCGGSGNLGREVQPSANVSPANYSSTSASNYDRYSRSSIGNSSSSYAGSCEYSWQTDSKGRSCGNRAASQRPDYNYSNSNYSSSYGTQTVRGYYRSNGTYVNGYTRSRGRR